MKKIPDWARTLTRSLLEALNKKDPYTHGHCCRVARNARLIARAIGMSEADQNRVEYTALFHDLGKIGIPDAILLKPSHLTDAEDEVMKTHPVLSEEILEPLSIHPFFKALLPGVRHHHERIDGQGYPDSLSGDDIPIESRIILIADTFDAMTTDRPYRAGKNPEEAYRELNKFSGTQFDPDLVRIFLQFHPKWGDPSPYVSEDFVATRLRKVA